MTAKVELRLEGQMDHLRLAWQAGETLLANVPFTEDPDSLRYNILLSIQELLTNVLRHGYESGQEGPIVVCLEASEEGFAFELRDRGMAFDPLQYESERGDDDEFPVEAGGYGIVIVKMVMDGLDYVYEDGWNVLRASKSVHASIPEVDEAAVPSDTEA